MIYKLRIRIRNRKKIKKSLNSLIKEKEDLIFELNNRKNSNREIVGSKQTVDELRIKSTLSYDKNIRESRVEKLNSVRLRKLIDASNMDRKYLKKRIDKFIESRNNKSKEHKTAINMMESGFNTRLTSLKKTETEFGFNFASTALTK